MSENFRELMNVLKLKLQAGLSNSRDPGQLPQPLVPVPIYWEATVFLALAAPKMVIFFRNNIQVYRLPIKLSTFHLQCGQLTPGMEV